MNAIVSMRAWIAALLYTMIVCQAAAADEVVSLVLQWNHQAQFAGYYMALEKGLYRQAGLEAQIRRGGPDVGHLDEVAQGRADFCCAMLPTAIERREQGLPLVLVAQVVNRGNFMLVAWKRPEGNSAAAVTQPSDLTGRRVSVWRQDYRTAYLAFFGEHSAKPEILPQYYTLSLFLNRGVAACSAMRYNEYHTLLQNGVSPSDLTVFNLWEMGANLPEDGLFCLESTWQARPEVCRRFARASMEGWQYARDHQEETLDVVMRYIRQDNLPTNRPHMRWMLTEILRSIFPETGQPWVPGVLSEQAYQETTRLLVRHGRITSAPAYREFVKMGANDVAP